MHRFVQFAVLCLAISLLPAAIAAQDQTPISAEVDVRTDLAIEGSLAQRFDQIDGLEPVEPSVTAGIVRLEGKVLSESERDQAESIARRTEGVVEVDNRIEVETRVRERIAPALDEAIVRLRSLAAYLPLLVVSLLIIVLFAGLGRLISRWQAPFKRVSHNPFVRELWRQAIRAATLVVGILIALEILDATALVGAVLGTAGVLGLALGFAFRDLVENYIASILLSLRQPFSPGDHIKIDDREGKVVRLTSRATILMTVDGNHLRIPNAQVFKGVILNYSLNPRRRFDFGVGVGVDEDLVEARRLGLEVMERMPGVLDDPSPSTLIVELGDSNVSITFFGWVDQREVDFWKVRSEAIRLVKTDLEDAGMDLPEPIYRVQLTGKAPAEVESESAERPLKAKAPSTVSNDRVQGDVSTDDAVDRQIAEDRAQNPETDLLDSSAPQE